MKSTIPTSPPPLPIYGAAELKEQININTIRGFAFSFGFIIMLLASYFSLTMLRGAQRIAPILKDSYGIIVVMPPKSIDSKDISIPPLPSANILSKIGTEFKAGTPIPVPKMNLIDDIEFATLDKLSVSMTHQGSIPLNIFSKDAQVLPETTAVRIKMPIEEYPTEFEVEKEPGIDMEKLHSTLNYPAVPKKIGMEGKVVIRVLVGSKGDVLKTKIEYSDSEYFSQEAVRAIKETMFTPAIMGGIPVNCWIVIPINFKLK
jgi:protein TonB